MTIQEAIKIIDGLQLENVLEFEISTTDKQKNMLNEEQKALSIANSAIKKQIPEKVTEKSFYNPINTIIGECPACLKAVVFQCLYCHHCRQALDWNDKKKL